MKKRIAILGSTGSIGTQTLDVISRYPEMFEAELLTANTNADLLIEQSRKHLPNSVVIADEKKYKYVQDSLEDLPIKVFSGSKSIADLAGSDSVDIVLAAMVGFSGLYPVLAAIEKGKKIALANKETLVVAGSIIQKIANERNVEIIPVDSEHSAIFQCLVGEFKNEIEKIILTASGGPFRKKSKEELSKVTVKEALTHPNWCMGPKITIDSATMMNKGLEVIEAHWLFNVPSHKIEVMVHPQSIVHSMVQFTDGSVKAQLGVPDMRYPIHYALTYPDRLVNEFPRLDLFKIQNLEFEKPDPETFECLMLAYQSIEKGGNMPCILNAANEVAVQRFINQQISFLQIPELISKTMKEASFIKEPSIGDLYRSDKEAREIAKK